MFIVCVCGVVTTDQREFGRQFGGVHQNDHDSISIGVAHSAHCESVFGKRTLTKKVLWFEILFFALVPVCSWAGDGRYIVGITLFSHRDGSLLTVLCFLG